MKRRGRGHHGPHRGYGRTTITVPCELKMKMKSVGDHVNWSSVACKAFESKLNDVTQQEVVEHIDQAVERLRKLNSTQEHSESVQAGIEAGKRWAMNRATPSQLTAIEELRNEVSTSDWKQLFQNRRGARELAMRLLGGDRDEHRRGAARMFWREVLDERPKSTEFFGGFAEGALEIWNAVKDHI